MPDDLSALDRNVEQLQLVDTPSPSDKLYVSRNAEEYPSQLDAAMTLASLRGFASAVQTVFGRDGHIELQFGDIPGEMVFVEPYGAIVTDNVRDQIRHLEDGKAERDHSHSSAQITDFASGLNLAIQVSGGLTKSLDLDNGTLTLTGAGSGGAGTLELRDEGVPFGTAPVSLDVVGAAATLEHLGSGAYRLTVAGGSAPVASVNGQTGVVVLTTQHVTAHSSAPYATDTRLYTFLKAKLVAGLNVTLSFSDIQQTVTVNASGGTSGGASGLVSLDGVQSPGGDIDLIGVNGIAITPDNTLKRITFNGAHTHTSRQITAEVGAGLTGTEVQAQLNQLQTEKIPHTWRSTADGVAPLGSDARVPVAFLQVPLPLRVGYLPGPPDAGEEVTALVTMAVRVPAAPTIRGRSDVPPSGTVDILLQRIQPGGATSTVGIVRYAANTSTPVYVGGVETTVAEGDTLSFVFPTPADATLSGVEFFVKAIGLPT